MSKVTKIAVSYGLTINLGDYNNVKPEIMIEATLEKDEDAHVVTQALFDQAKHEIADMLQEMCMASIGRLNFNNCKDYGDVEAVCLKASTLYRYIHNLDRKQAVEEMVYPLWVEEQARRERLNQRMIQPAVAKGGKSAFSIHDPIADIIDQNDDERNLIEGQDD